jgi:hypothetical protein
MAEDFILEDAGEQSRPTAPSSGTYGRACPLIKSGAEGIFLPDTMVAEALLNTLNRRLKHTKAAA